jgi:tRNA 2-thiouridine synthesizing protein E
MLSEDGFLSDRDTWTPELARALAARIPLVLEEGHFEVIAFIRAYHERFHHLPTNRLFIKAPVRTACLIAGLPKPPGCL